MQKTNVVHAFNEVSDREPPRGQLRASVRIPIVDLNGHEVMRSVSLGVDNFATLEESKAKARAVREANPSYHVSARFTVDL